MQLKRSLSEMERTEAQRFVRQGKANARTLTRGWVLLKLADGWDEARIAETFAIAQVTVKNVARRVTEGGLDRVLHDQVRASTAASPDWRASGSSDRSEL